MLKPNKKLNIVIADEDADNHNFIRKAILDTKSDHSVSSVYNATELLDYLIKTGFCPKLTPDCILLDINLPLPEGHGTMERIKRFAEFKNIGIYMLQTSVFPEHERKEISLVASSLNAKDSNTEILKAILPDIFKQVEIK